MEFNKIWSETNQKRGYQTYGELDLETLQDDNYMNDIVEEEINEFNREEEGSKKLKRLLICFKQIEDDNHK